MEEEFSWGDEKKICANVQIGDWTGEEYEAIKLQQYEHR